MKTKSIIIMVMLAGAFGVLLPSIGSAQESAKAKEQIIQLNKNFMKWFNSGQVDQIVSLYDPEACLAGRGCGKDFITEYYKNESGKYTFEELVTTEVTVTNDTAVEKGRWKLIFPNGMTMTGNYRSEWKRSGDKWTILREAVEP